MKRTYLPGLVDVIDVSDPREIEAVNADVRFDRKFNSGKCPLNWLLLKRSLSVLSIGGRRFPTITSRDSDARRSDQLALLNRLNLRVSRVKTGPEELEPLADWVRGNAPEDALGMRAQELLGRLFHEDFLATPKSWDAAITLVRAPRLSNIFKLFWWNVTGKVRRAKLLLASLMKNDLSAVNAIGIAVHNLAKSLRSMKSLYADQDSRKNLSPKEAVSRCLAAPLSLYREAIGDGEFRGCAFSAGSLFVLNIGEAAEKDVTGRLVFMSDSWSHCPAQHWIPAMLEGVWVRARTGNSLQEQQ